jgi:cytochrome c2
MPLIESAYEGGDMAVFLLKSILSIALVLSAFVAMITMFEIFGRETRKYDMKILKKVHRLNGMIYVLSFAIISYFCLDYIQATKVELSARASMHSALAIAVLSILLVKILFVKVYKNFYGQAKALGLTVVILTFVMAGISGGYYFLAGGATGKLSVTAEEPKLELRTDVKSIERGKDLYESKCFLCHDPYSNKTITGPGHKGILKNPLLPVSGKPATPENIARQLWKPYSQMPSFDYISADERSDIIAFLNTL